MVIVSIQYLRALAVLSVAVYHVGNHAGVSFETGAAGVDLFFVISGFIMWTITARKPTGPGAFLTDRITRIAPPYILLTVLTYLTARFVPAVFPNMRLDVQHAVLSAFFVPHTSPLGDRFPLIVPGWTLTYEIFFYVLFAAMLPLPPRARLRWSTAALLLLPAAGFLLGTGSPAVATYTSPLLLEFCGGLWLGAAWTSRRLPGPAVGAAALAAGTAGFVLWEVLLGTNPFDGRTLVWGVPAVLMVGGALALEQHLRIPRSRLLLLVANASYSMYLVNIFAAAASWRLFHGHSLLALYAAGMVLSVGGGLLFWWLVERPLTRMVRQWVHRPAPVVEAVPPASIAS